MTGISSEDRKAILAVASQPAQPVEGAVLEVLRQVVEGDEPDERALGGPGSGNWGHGGTPGRGGSPPRGSRVINLTKDYDDMNPLEQAIFSSLWEDVHDRASDPSDESYKIKSALTRRPVNVFHGTTDAALGSIAEKGLVPKGGSGADTWARIKNPDMAAESIDIADALIEGRDVSIFVTKNPRAAESFGLLAATNVTGAKAVVLEISIPQGKHPRVYPDEMSPYTRIEGMIPPEWIRVVTPEGAKPISNYRAMEEVLRLYAMFIVVDPSVRGLDRALGGPGSGNWGHTGTPGRGGSPPKGGVAVAGPVDELPHVKAAIHEAHKAAFRLEAGFAKFNDVESSKALHASREADAHAKKLIFEEMSKKGLGDPLAVDEIDPKLGDMLTEEVDKAVEAVGLIDNSNIPLPMLHFAPGSRSSALPGGLIKLGEHFSQSGFDTIVHEIGHQYEFESSALLKAAQKLQDARAKRRYDMAATGRLDFPSPYTAKRYPDGWTEVISTGLEEFMRNPARLKRRDPEHFALIRDMLEGRYGTR